MGETLHHPHKREVHTMDQSVEKALESLAELKDQAEADAKEHSSSEKLDKIHKSVETHAISGKEMSPAEDSESTSQSSGYVNKELKEISFERTMKNVRRHLRAPEKTFSKVIHNPVIDKVSDVASTTVARPSGLIGGGLFALIGSALLLWISRKYGYEYNYLVFFMLFGAGFLLGMITELGLWAYRHKVKKV